MNPALCSVLYFSCTSRVCVYQEIRMIGGIQPPQTTMLLRSGRGGGAIVVAAAGGRGTSPHGSSLLLPPDAKARQRHHASGLGRRHDTAMLSPTTTPRTWLYGSIAVDHRSAGHGSRHYFVGVTIAWLSSSHCERAKVFTTQGGAGRQGSHTKLSLSTIYM